MMGILAECYKFNVVEGTQLGKACVARESIEEGEIICKMSGSIITLRDFIEKYADINECNPLQIGKDQFIDLLEPYCCFNHSCDPNAGLRNDGILFAIRKIDIGQEIMYDYSTSVDDVLWSMDCKCHSQICRFKIGDFQSIPHERKNFYLENNALTSHIKSTYY